MLSWSSAWHVGISIINPELAWKRISWHIKSLETFQLHLDCKGYSCHQWLMSTWHGTNHMMQLMEWRCFLLTVKHENTLIVYIITFQLNQGTCVLSCAQMDSTHLSHLLLLILVGRSYLPPKMCMRSKFMFLSMVIPSPNSLGRNIDVCLRLLIDELTLLWSSRALTYDISRKQNYLMRTALMWTINDFLAYEMVYGWSK